MRKLVGSQHRQRIGDRDAVVAAQRRPLGKEIGAVLTQTQAVGGKVDVAAGVLFANHVQMALQNDRRVILITGRAVFVDDNVVVRVLHILQAVRLRKADTVVGDALGVARAVRNGAQLFKIVQRRLRAQMFQNGHRKHSFPILV